MELVEYSLVQKLFSVPVVQNL